MTQPVYPNTTTETLADLQQRVAYLQAHSIPTIQDQSGNTLMDLFGLRLGITSLVSTSSISNPDSFGFNYILFLTPPSSEVYIDADFPQSAGTNGLPNGGVSGPLQTTRTAPFTVTTSSAEEQTEILVMANVLAWLFVSKTGTTFDFDGNGTAGGVKVVIEDSQNNVVLSGQQFLLQGNTGLVLLDNAIAQAYSPYVYAPLTASQDAGATTTVINGQTYTQGTFTACLQYLVYYPSGATFKGQMGFDIENLQVLRLGHS